jgi:hypothetical protein
MATQPDADAVRQGVADVFAWDASGEIAARVGLEIDRCLAGLPEEAAGTVARLITATGGVRLAGEYLRVAAAGDTAVGALLEQVARETDDVQRGRQMYELGRLMFGVPAGATTVVLGDLEEVLRGPEATLCPEDDAARPVLETMLAQLGSGLQEFVENQDEVSGPNARVRQGVVKTWHLPDGTRVASKRRNPHKPERFARELENWTAVADRVGGEDGHRSPFGDPSRPRYVAVVPRLGLVRDQASKEVFAISRWIWGTSIESLLHELPEGPRRRGILADYRALLDFLFDRGVLWGDMSPRNVLVDDTEVPTYWLVDFEKTTVVDAPVSFPDRVDFCRGQVAVEELGVLCTRPELEEVLSGYFDLAAWDFRSNAPLSFAPRPEVAALLRARSVVTPTQGQYHAADLEILHVRSPDTDPVTGRRRLVGLVGFRVEHYLSCAGLDTASDYDTRTTEILIAARRVGYFDPVWDLLDEAARRLEREFTVSEFFGVLRRTGSWSPTTVPSVHVCALTLAIDQLYACGDDAEALRARVAHIRSELLP